VHHQGSVGSGGEVLEPQATARVSLSLVIVSTTANSLTRSLTLPKGGQIQRPTLRFNSLSHRLASPLCKLLWLLDSQQQGGAPQTPSKAMHVQRWGLLVSFAEKSVCVCVRATTRRSTYSHSLHSRSANAVIAQGPATRGPPCPSWGGAANRLRGGPTACAPSPTANHKLANRARLHVRMLLNLTLQLFGLTTWVATSCTAARSHQ